MKVLLLLFIFFEGLENFLSLDILGKFSKLLHHQDKILYIFAITRAFFFLLSLTLSLLFYLVACFTGQRTFFDFHSFVIIQFCICTSDIITMHFTMSLVEHTHSLSLPLFSFFFWYPILWICCLLLYSCWF